MEFNATPTNMTAILVVALAILTIIFLLRKRYESNLPLLFYFLAISFTNAVERPVNPFLMYSGLVMALVLRFEFMGKGPTKFVAFCATSLLVGIVWAMMSDVLAS
jgi:hypothetical protein